MTNYALAYRILLDVSFSIKFCLDVTPVIYNLHHMLRIKDVVLLRWMLSLSYYVACCSAIDHLESWTWMRVHIHVTMDPAMDMDGLFVCFLCYADARSTAETHIHVMHVAVWALSCLYML